MLLLVVGCSVSLGATQDPLSLSLTAAEAAACEWAGHAQGVAHDTTAGPTGLCCTHVRPFRPWRAAAQRF